MSSATLPPFAGGEEVRASLAVADGAEAVLRALDQRLRAVARVLVPESSLPAVALREGTAGLLTALVARCRGRDGASATWLLLTALHAKYPDSAQVEQTVRVVTTRSPGAAARELLAAALADADQLNRLAPLLEVVRDGTLVEVDFCARHDTHSGIQRLVRELMPRWTSAHGVRMAVWTAGFEALRAPEPAETDRVLLPPADGGSTAPPMRNDVEVGRLTILVPWGMRVVFPDVPAAGAADALAAMGQYSPNDLIVVGYDLTSVTNADERPRQETEAAVRWLGAVKHSRLVAAISESARTEFDGFVHALSAQGLAGPEVVAVPLAEHPLPPQRRDPRHGRPVVIVPGRREPHKNQRAALHAAEVLWREGLDFEVRMTGGAGWEPSTVEATLERLTRAGYPLTVLGWVEDDVQWHTIANADVAVFASVHEGYGLSVTECLALGVPTITTGYGSQAEIAAGGGCLLVDPRDDRSLVDALRSLLTDPALRDRLRAEGLARPKRTWDEYADELWETVVHVGVTG